LTSVAFAVLPQRRVEALLGFVVDVVSPAEDGVAGGLWVGDIDHAERGVGAARGVDAVLVGPPEAVATPSNSSSYAATRARSVHRSRCDRARTTSCSGSSFVRP